MRLPSPSRLRQRLSNNGLGATLIRRGFGSAMIQGTQIAARVLTAVVLARVLGASGFGIYALIMAIMRLVNFPIHSGIAKVGVRFTASYAANSCWGALRGLWLRLGQWTLAYGVIACTVILCTIYVVNYGQDANTLVMTLATAAPLAVLLPVATALGGLIRGMNRTVLGQMPEFFVRPIGFLVLVLVTAWMLGPRQFEPEQALLLQVLAAAIAAILGVYWLRNTRPIEARTAAVTYHSAQWLKAALPLSLTGGMMLINSETDILMLGALAEPSDVGIYRAATQGANLVVFPLLAMNLVLAPQISKLYAQDRHRALQQVLTWGTRIIFIGAVCVAISFWLFGSRILALVFGSAFAVGYAPLAILCFGQLISAGCGPVGTILNMTGFERDTAVGAGIGALLNIVLNAALIPALGMLGAALATATSLMLWNGILVYRVHRRTGLASAVWSSRTVRL